MVKAIGAGGVLLLIAAGPLDAQPPSPSAPVPPTATGTRLSDLEENPARYVGLTVTVYAEVEDVLGPRVFKIDEPNWADLDGEILVVMDGALAAAVDENDRVTLTGRVERYAEGRLSSEWGWSTLEKDLEARLRGRPVLIATTLVNHDADIPLVIAVPPERQDKAGVEQRPPLTDLADLARGTGEGLVRRRAVLDAVRVDRTDRTGGFWVRSGEEELYVLPTTPSGWVKAGATVRVEGHVLRMPAHMEARLERSRRVGNEEIYVFATSVKERSPGGQDIFPFRVHERVLENGMRLVVVPYDSPGLVSFYLVVRTGSRDEVEPGHSGFAHFFEHMMFRGTKRYPADAYNEALKRMGVDANASTWDDRTVYYMTGPASGFETMVEIEADRFLNLEYSEDAFRTEALAVLGEYNKSASNPFLAMSEKLRSLAFTAHTYRHTTLGFLEDIKAMPGYYDYSLRFFRRFYRPENVIGLVVGDVQPERAFTVLTGQFRGWKPGYDPPTVTPEPPQAERKTAHIEWPNPTRPYLMLGYHTPAFSTEATDFPALDVISELLFSEAAPLYQQIVVSEQWADFISGGVEDHRDPYLFTVAARARSAEAVPKIMAAYRQHVEQLKRSPVDAARLERIKSHLRYRFALALETPDALADTLSHYLGLTGSASTINELFRRYQEIAPADIQRVARQTFRLENETAVTLAEKGTRLTLKEERR